MSPIKTLEEALSAGNDFAALAGKLRDKFKSGTADLQALYDEAERVVDAALAKARDGLAAFKAEVEKEGDDTPAAPVVDHDAGTTTQTAGDGLAPAADPVPTIQAVP